MLCDAILLDLDLLCAHAKENGLPYLKKFPEVVTLYKTSKNDPLNGDYVGVGLGSRRLNLGFYAVPIVRQLIEWMNIRGAEISEASQSSLSQHIAFSSSNIDLSQYFVTKVGVYEMSRKGGTWCILKRIEY